MWKSMICILTSYVIHWSKAPYVNKAKKMWVSRHGYGLGTNMFSKFRTKYKISMKIPCFILNPRNYNAVSQVHNSILICFLGSALNPQVLLCHSEITQTLKKQSQAIPFSDYYSCSIIPIDCPKQPARQLPWLFILCLHITVILRIVPNKQPKKHEKLDMTSFASDVIFLSSVDNYRPWQ